MTRSSAPSRPRALLKPLIITIDGPSGAGKSTVAKLLAKRLGLAYLDTGATYRALAYEALARGTDLRDPRALVRLARALRLELRQAPSGDLAVVVNGCEVTRRIRTERVTEGAAVLAQHPAVRAEMVRFQRRLARDQAVVAEGRDTGSMVFPQAPYKFFLTAAVRVRARRRQQELRGVQRRVPTLSAIAGHLRRRDGLDRRRAVGPLVRPPGAVAVDTTRRSADEVVERLLQAISGCKDAKLSVC